MKKLAIIHTTPATIDSLVDLVNEVISDCEIINFLDDSILPELIKNNGDISKVEDRIKQYIQFAQKSGADLILSACSSIGEIFNVADDIMEVPVLRIDEAMAKEAVETAERIGVAATLSTTLQPTLDLLKNKAKAKNKYPDFESYLIEEAYAELISGNKEEHDKLLVNGLEQMVKRNEIVVLAQASMARVLDKLPKKERDKFVTSPHRGIKHVKKILEEI